MMKDIVLNALITAAKEANPCEMSPTGCKESGDASNLVQRIVTTLILICGVASVLVIIYGGFLMMTSAGDPGKIQKGKGAVLGAIIGLIICMSAYTIAYFVFKTIAGA